MPGKKTAQDLVNEVRDHLHHIGSQTTYRDGFAADATDPVTGQPSTATPILRWVNKAYEELLKTGIAKCPFTLTLIPGQAEYRLVADIHEILHATLNGASLKVSTLPGMDRRSPGWQAYPGLATVGQPVRTVRLAQPATIYSYADVIGFDPAPDLAYTVVILADDTPADMTLPTDYPERVPGRCQSALASRAAAWLSNMDIENTAAAARVPMLMADWNMAVKDCESIVQQREVEEDSQVDAGQYREWYRGGY